MEDATITEAGGPGQNRICSDYITDMPTLWNEIPFFPVMSSLLPFAALLVTVKTVKTFPHGDEPFTIPQVGVEGVRHQFTVCGYKQKVGKETVVYPSVL